MGKVLVVVYSYTGTGRRLAQLLCGMQGWSLGEIVEARPRASGLGATWRCLFDSWFRRRPAIRYVGAPPEEFDAVVLVAPIWIHRLAGPMRSFVAQYRHSLPDVAVCSVMGGSGAPNAVAEIGEILGRSPMLSTAFTSGEVEDGSCAARLQAFGKAVQAAEESQLVLRAATWSPQAA